MLVCSFHFVNFSFFSNFNFVEAAANNTNRLPLDAYAIVIDSLSVLTENLRENLNILRDWGCMEWLLEMVVNPTTRPAALRLMLQSIKLDTSVENSHGFVIYFHFIFYYYFIDN